MGGKRDAGDALHQYPNLIGLYNRVDIIQASYLFTLLFIIELFRVISINKETKKIKNDQNGTNGIN